MRANVHCKNGIIFAQKRRCWSDGSRRVTILCFWGAQLDLKIKDGAHILHAGKRACRDQTGLNAMKPAMADEEVGTRDSDGRSYSGSREMLGSIFRSCQ